MSIKHTIKALANNPTVTELLIYGDIGEDFWAEESNDAKSIVAKLDAISTPDIHIRINSNGGSVVDAIAIYNAAKRHAATITVFIDGVAFSAASLIAMAGDTVIMAANALFMIHAPSTISRGNAEQFRIDADTLDKYADAMAHSYMEKTGKSKDEIDALLKDGLDHYFTAEEAKAEGFIDAINEAASIQIAAIATRFKPPQAWLAQNQLQGNTPMPTEQKPNSETTPTPQAVIDDSITAKAKETERQTSIKAIYAHVPVDRTDIHALLPTMLIDASITEEKAREQILAKIGENQQPVGKSHHIQMGADETDTFKMLVTASLSARAGIEKDSEKSRILRGSSLLMLAEKSLNIQGINTHSMSKQQMVSAAFTHSSSDFGNLLANVAEKAMMKGYDEAQETFQLWTTAGSAGDFKPVSRVDLNTFPSLDNVSEGAEYKYGTIGDRGETVQLATYGKLFSITREAIINDDLNAFTKIPMKMGRAAIRTIGDLVYAVLTANAAMADGVALFHSTHKNLLTSAVMSTASIDAMAVAMGLQTDGGANAKGLNIPLSYIICPLALRGLANTIRTSQYRVGDADTKMANTAPNVVQNTFEVIADARLDAASSTNWYGAANPGQFDTVEVTYLDGIQTPYLEQQDGFTTDGAVFKVRMDAGVKALDFRTLAKNPN